MYRDNGTVSGFYLPDLGEGLVIAENDQAGFELMRVRLSRSNKATVPAPNTAGIAFLEQLGFREVRRSTRMVLGAPYSWKPERIYSRIAGNLG